MHENPIAFASVLKLSREDIKILQVKDAYALHKVVYGLFEDIRTEAEKNKSVASGILYVDKGGDSNTRQILLLSNRKPHQTPQFGKVETKPVYANFLQHTDYAFQTTLNPTQRNNLSRKIVPVRGREAITTWFVQRAITSWGFSVMVEDLQVEQCNIQSVEKSGETVTHGSATLKGRLTVTDHERFKQSFCKGIGRGRAFGFGLLQIVPLSAI
ncbi:type I-E CRISPR-associated protein Cas6/Cse3/CasE [Undibacterium sp. RuRC25W]|uniref:type I-E CRISPR-associated protein Cas6/Cse3/CasE n=1 Tax=Undibacterium sp. RuRC25W TaxID=3413047 RepID=UPI003BF4568B